MEALAAYNLAGNLPTQVGFERELAARLEVVLSDELLARPLPGAHAGGRVEVAYGERLV